MKVFRSAILILIVFVAASAVLMGQEEIQITICEVEVRLLSIKGFLPNTGIDGHHTGPLYWSFGIQVIDRSQFQSVPQGENEDLFYQVGPINEEEFRFADTLIYQADIKFDPGALVFLSTRAFQFEPVLLRVKAKTSLLIDKLPEGSNSGDDHIDLNEYSTPGNGHVLDCLRESTTTHEAISFLGPISTLRYKYEITIRRINIR